VARCYQSISVLSVHVESMLSTTGLISLILNSTRSSLVPHKLKYIKCILLLTHSKWLGRKLLPAATNQPRDEVHCVMAKIWFLFSCRPYHSDWVSWVLINQHNVTVCQLAQSCWAEPMFLCYSRWRHLLGLHYSNAVDVSVSCHARASFKTIMLEPRIESIDNITI